MKALAELVIATFELMEAEGRALREGVYYLAAVIVLLVATLATGLGGLALLALGFYRGMVVVIGEVWTPVTLGVIALSLTGAGLWMANRLVR